MGCGGSKDDTEDDNILRFQDIYYDEEGNLRVGRAHVKTKEQKEKELRDILNIEAGDDMDAEDVTWYIMDASWIAAWFAYVHYESETAPYPGPCRNERLLRPDYTLQKWVPQDRLVMASKKRSGDYRRVSRKTWELYSELYPGCGPTITTVFKNVIQYANYGFMYFSNLKQDDNFKESGLYDTSGWNIDQDFPLPPDPKNNERPVPVTDEERKQATNALHEDVFPKHEEDQMVDKTQSRSLQVQMDFLGTKRLEEIEAKKKQRKKKRQF